MRRIRAFFLRLAALFRRTSREAELSEELESLIEMHTEENIRAGMLPEEARRQAILRFGSVEWTKVECRDQLVLAWLETFLLDMRYAARSIARNPVYAAAVMAILACGIGATTAMFAVVRAIVLPRLPYTDPANLAGIYMTDRQVPSAGANVSSGDFADWQRMNTVFSGMASYGGIDERGKVRFQLFLTGDGEARRIMGLVVSTNLFDVLGVAPMQGRGFTSDDDHVAILSYACWQRHFASDPKIIGRSVLLSGERREVIGVMPKTFFFPTQEVEVFVPPGKFTPERVFHDLGVVARLRPGSSFREAREQMAGIGAMLERAFPASNAGLIPQVESWPAMLSASRRAALRLLLIAVAVLFLIVCSNIAHLQLGRAVSRVKELRIRKALGASRGRLARQLAAENLLLSLLGGLFGWGIACAACSALTRMAPDLIPSYAELQIDTSLTLFNGAITLLAPFLFGIVPVLTATSPDGLGERAGSASRASRRVRDVLVAVQVALSVVLVVFAGLLAKSFVRLQAVDPGFRAEHALSFRLELGDLVPDEKQRGRQISEIGRHLLEEHGIEEAGATARPLLGGGSGGEAGVTIQGRECSLRLEVVTSGYFPAVRARLLRGRLPNASDTEKSALVMVVNAAFEKTYFPDENSVGKQIKLGGRGWVRIAGVVADLKQEAMDRPAQPAAFLSAKQIIPHSVTFVVRGPGEPRELTAAARHAVHAVNASLPLTDVATLKELVQASIRSQRIRAVLLFLIAGTALFLAALGVYGVLAYSVTQRSGEISIRMALGAPSRAVFGLVLLDGMRPVVMGGGIGFAAAYSASRLLRSLLFGIIPGDPWTYLMAFAVLAIAAVCACLAPAMQAIHMDPMQAIRRE